MATENVGTIYYDVVGDTSKLVNSATAGEKSIDQLEASFKKADGAQRGLQTNLTKTASAVKEVTTQAERAGGVLQGLNGLFAGLVTGATVLNLINMAEAYNETSERIKMATKDAAEYEMVQQRLIKTANAIYRPLKEAQETYILTADSLRSMNYTTSQALDITDSLSLSFVKNATSSDRAQSAISAFTKSMQKGRVEADAWESLMAAVPTIVNDIAASSKKTSAEIRQMGVEGKLTATMLAEGLRQSLEQNEAAAAGMATTLKDAFNNVSNNLAVFLGEANSATGATGVLSKAVLAFGNNISTVANLLGALGAGALARYVVQVAAGITASVQAAIAARAQAVAEVQKAQALVASTAATAANAAATSGLIASNTSAAAATAAHTTAVAGLATAQRGMAAAGLGLSALLGGPAGIVALLAAGAAAAYLFSDSNNTAKSTLEGFAQSAEVAAEKLRNMTESQQALARIDATSNITKGLDDLDIAANKLIAGPFFTGRAGIEWVDTAREQIRALTQQFNNQEISAKDLDARLIDMVNTYAVANGMSQSWTQKQYENVSAVSAAAQATDTAKRSINNMDEALIQIQHSANMAALGINNVTNAMGGVSAAETKALDDMDKALATFGKNGAASMLYDIAQARGGLGALKDFSTATLNQLERDAKALDKLQSQKKGAAGAGKAQRLENSQEQALIDVRKQIEAFGKTTSEQKIFAISEALRGVGTMSKFSKTALAELKSEYEKLAELERNQKAVEFIKGLKENADEVGKMTASERLQYDIVAKKVVLNAKQLAQATELAGIVDARTKKEKDLEDSLSKQNANLATQRQLQAQLLKYALDLDGATLGSDARGRMEERAQMEQQFADRIQDIQNRRRDAVAKADKRDLPRVEQLYDDQLKIEKAYQEKSLEAYMAYTAKKKAQDEDWRIGALRAIAEYQEAAQNTAKQAETAFGNFLKNTEDALVEFVKTGKFSFRSLADSIIADIARMAAKSLTSGFAGLLGSALGSYFGVPTGSSSGGSSSLGIGNTGSLGSTDYSLGGSGGLGLKLPGRANGGPVQSGSMYRVNEKGTPELLNVGGNQYLMMGNRSGTVDNMRGSVGGGGSSGAGSITVNVFNNTDSQVSTTERQSGDNRVIDIVIQRVAADIQRGGPVANTIQSTYGLNRGAGTARYGR
ncbi:MAG: tail tape measure protein [Caudoviricetes sp.]|nr:MAG: tail tape measure protein [Caudoviricetes sp.]